MSEEQILFTGSSSPIMNLGMFLFCGLVLIAGIVFGFVVPSPYSFILFGVGVLALAYGLAQWLLIKSCIYEVTTERIRITRGLLTRRTDELELYRVKDTTLVEPFSLRMFGLGNIEITTNDASTPLVRMLAIRNARKLREDLRGSIEACRDRKRVRLAELE